jgi:hypothetical protein
MAVGTIKSNSDVPPGVLWKKKDAGRERGDCRYLRSDDGTLLVQEWQVHELIVLWRCERCMLRCARVCVCGVWSSPG